TLKRKFVAVNLYSSSQTKWWVRLISTPPANLMAGPGSSARVHNPGFICSGPFMYAESRGYFHLHIPAPGRGTPPRNLGKRPPEHTDEALREGARLASKRLWS